MKSFKNIFIKAILLLGRKTFLGRGKLRKLLIYIIEKILSSKKYDPNKPLFTTKLWDFEIYFYADKKTGLKVYFERNENLEINYLKKNIPSNSWFIDIGSNIGLYTLNILNLNKNKRKINVLSIEPNKIIFERLKENISLLKKKNKYVNNKFKLFNSAVGEKNSNVIINTSYNHANAKIEKISKFSKKKDLSYVRMNTLTNIMKSVKIKNIYCIKIDTEGYEFNILRHFFRNTKPINYPNILIVEHNNEKMKKKKMDKFLINYAYEIAFNTNSNTVYKNYEKKG